MPGGDRTGPEGMGLMTGRAAGFCAGQEVAGWTTAPGFFARGAGGGFGGGPRSGRRGSGDGIRRRHAGSPGYGRRFAWGPGLGFQPQPSTDEHREMLAAELDALEQRTAALRREMESLEERKDSEA